MDLKQIGASIASLAPTIGGLIGGPIGTAAGSALLALTKALGLKSDASPDEINQAIQQDPQAALKLRMAEMDYQLALNKQKLDEQEMYLKDVQSARQREVETTKATGKRDINQYVLAWVVIAGFFGLVGLLIFHEVPQDQSGVVYMLFGALAAGFTGIMGYYFGSSKGSSEKTDLLAKAEAIK